MDVALLVAYDGTDFRGFARQPHARTVQGELEGALSTILREPIRTVGAGRTDAGVHASGQVVSLQVPDGTDPDRLRVRINRLITPQIVVRAAAAVPAGFSARFDARRRHYEYRCYRSDATDPFRDRFVLRIGGAVRLAPMRAGARALIGEHDFSSFCRRGPTTPVRRLRRLTVRSAGDELTFRVEADSFCHQMVRSITGLLLRVGEGKCPPEDVARALAARDRAAVFPVAPARGLHLVGVTYRPDPFAGTT